MKKCLISFLVLLLANVAVAQQKLIDSLKQLLTATNDTLALVYSCRLSLAYENSNQDSAALYAKHYLTLSKKLNYRLGQADALRQMAYYQAGSANGLELIYEANKLVEDDKEKIGLPVKYLERLGVPTHLQPYPVYRQHVLGFLDFLTGIQYWANQDNVKAISHWSKTLETGRSLADSQLLVLCYIAYGTIATNPDSALAHFERAYPLAQNAAPEAMTAIEAGLANSYQQKKDFQRQLSHLRAAIQQATQHGITIALGWNYLRLARYYEKETSNRDSLLLYGHKAFQIAIASNVSELEYQTTKLFFETFKREGNKDSAFKYLDLMLAAKENSSNEETARKFANADFNQQMKNAAVDASNERLRSRVKMYLLLAGLGFVICLSVIFWRVGNRKQKQYLMLQVQKTKTDQALRELKMAQSQLIQSEKMASLGELTAGIAHEIQNPLNFVNNFAEINSELVSEMKEALAKGNIDEAMTMANDIDSNEQKIMYHGKRADVIVKGMLQHSRTNPGHKELTDVNALADEYVRLAYHGLRAKDSSFNATIKTDYDQRIGKIEIVPQDIGRVILNLITNAFYAVIEKKKQMSGDYEPIVSISTKRAENKIEITVADNGNGIPQKVLDKIFQPFFTTKPTGQGTGLGLSLSYDIIKAHGGEITVDTKEGEGTIFIITLPIK